MAFNDRDYTIIERYYIKTYVRIHLNSDPDSVWQFYNPADSTTLTPHYGQRRSVIVFRRKDGGAFKSNDFPLVEDGLNYLKTSYPLILEYDQDYYVDVFDYQGNQWRAGSSSTPPGQYLIHTEYPGTVTNTTIISEIDGNILYKTITYTIDPDSPLTIEIYPESDPPSEADFTALTLDLNFDQLIDDSTHSSGWATAYNAGNIYWVNGTKWGIQWVNVQNGINGNKLHPSINLYWCVTDTNEVLSPQQIYERSQLLDAGKGDYRTYIDQGYTYSPNPGSEFDGYIEIDLKAAYCPHGVPEPTSFQGRGKLHFTMGMTGVDYQNWKTTVIDILHEPVASTGGISATVKEVSSRSATIQLTGFISTPENLQSPVKTRYQIDGGSWVERSGYADVLQVTGLTPNANHSVNIEVAYMNQSVDKSTYLVSIQTTPGIDNLSFNILPKLQPSGETLYDLTLTATENNNGTVQFAFLRDSIQRNYSNLDLSSLDLAYFVDYQSQSTYTFTDLSESDIEGYYWVVLVRDASNTTNMSWSTLFMTQQSITGADSPSPSTSQGVEITIPKENSNRYVKDVLIGSLEAGLLQFDATNTITKTYQLHTRKVNSISIEVEDYVPASFPGSVEDYIQYAVIINGRRYPITPLNRSGSHPHIYHINISVPEDERRLRRALREEFIDVSGEVNSFQVEATLSRDPDQPHLTPIVYNWRVKAVVSQRTSTYLGNIAASNISTIINVESTMEKIYEKGPGSEPQS